MSNHQPRLVGTLLDEELPELMACVWESLRGHDRLFIRQAELLTRQEALMDRQEALMDRQEALMDRQERDTLPDSGDLQRVIH